MVEEFKSYTTNETISFCHIKEAVNKNYLAAIIAVKYNTTKDDLAVDCWEKIWKPENKSKYLEEAPFEESLDHLLDEKQKKIKTIRSSYKAHIMAYSNKLVSTHLQNRQTRITTKVVVSWFLKKRNFSEKNKNDVKSRKSLKMEETLREFLKNSNESYIKRSRTLLCEIGTFSFEETVLYDWQLQMIEEDEACELLGVCRATLFNRWKKLKIKLLEVYYDPKHKSKEDTSQILDEQ